MQALIEHTNEEAVAWQPDGKSFVIVNPDIFCNNVLNKKIQGDQICQISSQTLLMGLCEPHQWDEDGLFSSSHV
jgi:hypothetical protein